MTSSPKVLHQIGFWLDPWGGGPGLLKWSGEPGTDPYGPGPGVDPATLINPGWAVAERGLLVRYLQTGCTYSLFYGFSYCRLAQICRVSNHEMGTRTLMDGVWAWPEGLWHYVAIHQICLPDEFLAHAQHNRFVVPATAEEADYSGSTLSSEKWDQWAQLNGTYHY